MIGILHYDTTMHYPLNSLQVTVLIFTLYTNVSIPIYVPISALVIKQLG